MLKHLRFNDFFLTSSKRSYLLAFGSVFGALRLIFKSDILEQVIYLLIFSGRFFGFSFFVFSLSFFYPFSVA